MPLDRRILLYPGSSPATIAPLIVGFVLLILASLYEMRTKREPLLPPSIFKNITAGISLKGELAPGTGLKIN